MYLYSWIFVLNVCVMLVCVMYEWAVCFACSYFMTLFYRATEAEIRGLPVRYYRIPDSGVVTK